MFLSAKDAGLPITQVLNSFPSRVCKFHWTPWRPTYQTDELYEPWLRNRLNCCSRASKYLLHVKQPVLISRVCQEEKGGGEALLQIVLQNTRHW